MGKKEQKKKIKLDVGKLTIKRKDTIGFLQFSSFEGEKNHAVILLNIRIEWATFCMERVY